MSEVTKTVVRYSRDFQGNLSVDPNGSWVLAADAAINAKRLMNHIDRVTAERDAERRRADVAVIDANDAEAAGKKVSELLANRTAERDALQALLTAADERGDTAIAFVTRLIERAGGQPSVATGYLRDILDLLKPVEVGGEVVRIEYSSLDPVERLAVCRGEQPVAVVLPELDESAIDDLAGSSCQEALAFGVNQDVFARLARTVHKRTIDELKRLNPSL